MTQATLNFPFSICIDVPLPHMRLFIEIHNVKEISFKVNQAAAAWSIGLTDAVFRAMWICDIRHLRTHSGYRYAGLFLKGQHRWLGPGMCPAPTLLVLQFAFFNEIACNLWWCDISHYASQLDIKNYQISMSKKSIAKLFGFCWAWATMPSNDINKNWW